MIVQGGCVFGAAKMSTCDCDRWQSILGLKMWCDCGSVVVGC